MTKEPQLTNAERDLMLLKDLQAITKPFSAIRSWFGWSSEETRTSLLRLRERGQAEIDYGQGWRLSH